MGSWGKLQLWLQEAPRNPARILTVNAWSYAFFQTVAWAYLGAAIKAGSPDAIWIFCITVALPPYFVWTTYRTIRTAWLGLPPANAADVSVPFVTVALGAGLLWMIIR